MIQIKLKQIMGFSLCLLVLGSACSDESSLNSELELVGSTSNQPTPVDRSTSKKLVVVYNGARPCNGVLIGPAAVLTSKRCLRQNPAGTYDRKESKSSIKVYYQYDDRHLNSLTLREGAGEDSWLFLENSDLALLRLAQNTDLTQEETWKLPESCQQVSTADFTSRLKPANKKVEIFSAFVNGKLDETKTVRYAVRSTIQQVVESPLEQGRFLTTDPGKIEKIERGLLFDSGGPWVNSDQQIVAITSRVDANLGALVCDAVDQIRLKLDEWSESYTQKIEENLWLKESANGRNFLIADEPRFASLYLGDLLVSPNGKYELVFEDTGSLVLYEKSKFLGVTRRKNIWSLDTGTKGNHLSINDRFILQTNGNLLGMKAGMAGGRESVFFNSGSAKYHRDDCQAALVLHDNGNIMIYSVCQDQDTEEKTATPIYSTDTNELQPFKPNHSMAMDDEFPFVVKLLVSDTKGKNQPQSCTGTFISHNQVLTAAHCIPHQVIQNPGRDRTRPFPYDKIQAFKVVDGNQGILLGSSVEIYPHPQWVGEDLPPIQGRDLENNIALITFEDQTVKLFAQVIDVENVDEKQDFNIVGFDDYHVLGNSNPLDAYQIRQASVKVERRWNMLNVLTPNRSKQGKDTLAPCALGDFGGPMFLGERLVGICSGGYDKGGRLLSYYIDLSKSEFLKKSSEKPHVTEIAKNVWISAQEKGRNYLYSNFGQKAETEFSLLPGQSLISHNGRYKLEVSDLGELLLSKQFVETGTKKVLWQFSNGDVFEPVRYSLLKNGTFVAVNADGQETVIWPESDETEAVADGEKILILEDHGGIVIYSLDETGQFPKRLFQSPPDLDLGGFEGDGF